MPHPSPDHAQGVLRGLRKLARHDRGVSVVEFALLAPIFMGILLTVFEFGFAFYARGVLQGAVDAAARTASLENTEFTQISDRVSRQVKAVLPSSEAETDISFELDPSYYANYRDLQLPEDFEDNNNNDRWDSTECFVDRNANATYDTDVGVAGRGGAQDVVSISATLSYARPMPLWRMFGFSDRQTITVRTFLRNQPFSAQAAETSVKICPAS